MTENQYFGKQNNVLLINLILGAAAFGYLTFGSHVTADIMLSYDASRPEVIIGIIALALKTVSTYPILLFCGREAMRTALNDFMTLVKPSSIEAEQSSESSQDDNIKQRVIGENYGDWANTEILFKYEKIKFPEIFNKSMEIVFQKIQKRPINLANLPCRKWAFEPHRTVLCNFCKISFLQANLVHQIQNQKE